jgi:hypothetical protein
MLGTKPHKKWQELDPDEVARQINEEYYAEQRKKQIEEKARLIREAAERAEQEKQDLAEQKARDARLKRELNEAAKRFNRSDDSAALKKYSSLVVTFASFSLLQDILNIFSRYRMTPGNNLRRFTTKSARGWTYRIPLYSDCGAEDIKSEIIYYGKFRNVAVNVKIIPRKASSPN